MKQSEYPEYDAWKGAKRRGCVASWAVAREGFWNFLADVGRRPGKRYALLRKDTKLPFSKSNCSWEKRYDKLTVHGETRTIEEWSQIKGISPALIRRRLKAGFSPTYAILNPKQEIATLTFRGETKTLKEWSKITGIKYKTLFYRYSRQMSPSVILKGAVKPTQRNITYNGETRSLLGWAKKLGIPASTLAQRLETWSIDRALGTKRRKYYYYAVYSKKTLLGKVRVTELCTWRELFSKLKGKQPTLKEFKKLSLTQITKKEFLQWNSTKV